MTTLRSVIAHLATMIRYAGIAYIVVQVAIWHSFYAESPWRATAPALAVAWAAAAALHLRRHPPSELLTGADTAAYLALALAAQGGVPPQVRDSAFSWLVIAMSGQLIVPAWFAPGPLAALLALASPLAYLAGAELRPVTDVKMMTGAAILLLAVGLVHGWGRRVLYGRAASADADVARADQAAREQYAILCGNIERREHERLLHDTVLNTLTAVARGSGDAGAEAVTRCRQDVALLEAALGGADDLAADYARPSDDLLSEVRGVIADMRARGLTVHLAVEDPPADDPAAAAVPAWVSTAMSNAVREALSNVAAHAGTGEAWVSVGRGAPGADAEDACPLRITVHDKGAGFDLARVDQARLGLRRSITERTAECGGQASIWSAPGQGTEVSLCWPAPDRAGPSLDNRGLAQEVRPW
jgi:signal transduction histidine kinase